MKVYNRKCPPMKKVFFLLTLALTLPLLASCGKAATTVPSPSSPSLMDEGIKVEQVLLDSSALTVSVGKTVKVTASVLPKDADDQSLAFLVSDPSTAHVDENGTVTGNSIRIIFAAGEAGGSFCDRLMKQFPERICSLRLSVVQHTDTLAVAEYFSAVMGDPDDCAGKLLQCFGQFYFQLILQITVQSGKWLI